MFLMTDRKYVCIAWLMVDSAMVVLAIYLGSSAYNPLLYFDEGRFITWFSAIKLLATGILSFMIFHQRCQGENRYCREPAAVIWLLVTAGFIFLAGDELFQWHEKADEMIHHLMAMEETRMSDRIDDLIVGLYLTLGAGLLFAFRQELLRYIRVFPYLVPGFFVAFIMVALDMYTNLAPGDWISPPVIRLSIAEEACKLYAESLFFMVFFQVLPTAGKLWHNSPGTAGRDGALR
jgi:hypothetical protein